MLRSSSVRLGRRGSLWLRECVCGVWFWGGTMFRLARSGLPKRFLLLLVCLGMSFFGPLLPFHFVCPVRCRHGSFGNVASVT